MATKRWTLRRDNDLCDLIAVSFSWKDAGAVLGMDPADCKRRFMEIAASMGSQAR